MYRLVKMTQWHSLEISEDYLEDDLDDIKIFVDEGNIVVLCDDLEDFCEEFKINLSDIIIVD